MRRLTTTILLLVAIAAVLVLVTQPALGQCAMCRQAMESSSDAASLTRTMSVAVVVLLVPPVAIFAGIFGLIYRSRNSQDRRD
jgi:Na+/proline symporter